MFEPSPLPPEQRSWLRRTLNRWEVDQAVFYAVAYRAWQFLAGPITLILIVEFFTEEVQGYFYAFWSLIGLQLLLELSLPAVILTVASHEWSRLTLGPGRTIAGDAQALSRLSSLTRTALVWYGVSAVLFVAIVSVGGLYFFGRKTSTEVDWQLPWLALTMLSGVVFALTPLLTILEGCNQVKEVQRFQFLRAVIGNIVVWCCIPLGAGLWIPAIATLVRLVCELSLVFGGYRTFFLALFRRPTSGTIHWMNEVWPFQWKTGLKSIVVYVNGFFVIPVIFDTQGQAAAGRIGFTWNILTTLQAACGAWVKTRAALLGMLIVRKDYTELNRVFARLLRIAFAVFCLLSISFLGCVVLLGVWLPAYAARMAGPLPTALLCLAFACMLYNEMVWTYIHAHRQTPFLAWTVCTALLNGALCWWAGQEHGIDGVAVATLAINALLVAPLAGYAFRYARRWHE